MRRSCLRAFVLSAGLGLAPAAAFAGGQLPPCPPGWAQENWTNPDVQTPKYVVGRILAMFPHTPDGLKQALPLVDAVFPGAKILPGDGGVLYVPGVGDIDVIAGAGTGGRAWRWHVLRDECAQSGLCDPPKKGPAAAGASGSGGSSGGAGGSGGAGAGGGAGGGAKGRFTCNRFAEPAACWCGEWTDGIWAQRHYTAAHKCKPGFTLNGFPESRWHEWAIGIGEFIKYMESAFGSNNRDCDHPKAPADWKEVERLYWKVTEFSGFSGTGLADIGKSCAKGGSGSGQGSTTPVKAYRIGGG